MGTLLKVYITLITILNPKDQNGLALDDGDLPEPYRADRQARNQRLISEADKVGTKPYHRDGGASTALNNGVQPFEELKGRHIFASFVADMIEGRYHGVYSILTDSGNPKWSQRKIELRPGDLPTGEGVLTEGHDSHLETFLYILREDVDCLKIAGLWVNPKEDGHLEANLVLRAIQEENLDVVAPNPIQRNPHGYFVEITDQQRDEIYPH